jgi:hypothetical protein
MKYEGTTLRGSEGPARTAALLVTDGVDELRPLLAGIERRRDGVGGDNAVGLGGEGGVLTEESTEKLLGLADGPAAEALVLTGNPRRRVGVHVVDNVVVNEELVLFRERNRDSDAKSDKGSNQNGLHACKIGTNSHPFAFSLMSGGLTRKGHLGCVATSVTSFVVVFASA